MAFQIESFSLTDLADVTAASFRIPFCLHSAKPLLLSLRFEREGENLVPTCTSIVYCFYKGEARGGNRPICDLEADSINQPTPISNYISEMRRFATTFPNIYKNRRIF